MVTVRAAVEAAGFTGSAAQTMTGIVIAESGGNAWAYNPNRLTGDKSYGLAQINMIDSLGPARRQQYGLSSNDSLFDPTVNLGVAWIMSNHGTYWMDWSTYKRGEHLSHVNDVSTQITQTPENGSPHTDTTGPNPSTYAVIWAKPGKWTSYTSKPIADPPAGTMKYGKPTGTRAGDQSGDTPVDFPSSDDAKVWAWMMAYFDDGSLKAKWGNNRPDHLSLINQYGALLSDQRKAKLNEVPQPDPGQANAGVGGLGALGFGSLATLLKFLTSASNWRRIGLGLLGAIILIFAAFELFGSSSAGKSVESIGKVAAL